MAGKLVHSFLVIIMFFSLVPISCENNNEVALYGDQKCDTTNVTWDSKVAAILNKNCVMCHGEEIAYKGVRHDTYENEMIVVNDGRLNGVINHLDGFVKMPKDRGKLPECELLIINIWIKNGAPRN